MRVPGSTMGMGLRGRRRMWGGEKLTGVEEVGRAKVEEAEAAVGRRKEAAG